MSTNKLNISFDDAVSGWLRQRAREEGKSMSRYLSDLIRDDVRRSKEELAAEGYRVMGESGLEFARAALSPASEAWPATAPERAGPGCQSRRSGRWRR